MITIDELNKIRDEVSSAEVDILRRNSFQNGFDLAISALRYRGVLKDEPHPSVPTVKVWLPVVVLRDGRYWAYRGSSSNENDCLEDAQLFADRHLGIVHIVTAELPIPQKPEPIEVQGEVEHERDT